MLVAVPESTILTVAQHYILHVNSNTANEQCLLNCQTKEKNIPLYGKIQALDGTFCSYENKHTMCYAGTCIPLGCDGKFGSQLTEDECGVCQGDNSNCTQRKTYYTDKLDKGKRSVGC